MSLVFKMQLLLIPDGKLKTKNQIQYRCLSLCSICLAIACTDQPLMLTNSPSVGWARIPDKKHCLLTS